MESTSERCLWIDINEENFHSAAMNESMSLQQCQMYKRGWEGYKTLSNSKHTLYLYSTHLCGKPSNYSF